MKRRIRGLETELPIGRQSAKFLEEERPARRLFPVIDRLADAGILKPLLSLPGSAPTASNARLRPGPSCADSGRPD